VFFFFFQAEDGIRDGHVTGVQTCALPIYMWAIALALGVGAFFYAMCIAAVTYVAPWQELLGKRFATAIAFETALKARWPVSLIFTMALLGLFQCFNGNFAASTRLLFAFGRRGTIPSSFGGEI